jgi:uncharacterized protein
LSSGRVVRSLFGGRPRAGSSNIDIYTHFLPPDYAKSIRETTSRAYSDLYGIDGLIQLYPNLSEFEARLRHMETNGTELQVLTPLPVPVEKFIADSDRQTPGELVRIANDAMAEEVARHADRFVGVALLSFDDIGSAVTEMHRAVTKLGLKGAMIFTHIGGHPLDLPEFYPIYEKAIELGVPLWLHPISWDYFPWVREHLLWQIFCWPFDTTLAMARLVYGGVMERYPTLKLITHHAGGTVPFLLGRVIDVYDQERGFATLYGQGSIARDIAPLPQYRPEELFRTFYADVALSGWLPSLACAYDFFGSDRLVFGSDYPFGPERGERFLRSNLAAVEQLRLPRGEHSKILEKNARMLLGLGEKRSRSGQSEIRRNSA